MYWPLMKNNITREDLDVLIEYLKQDDPRITQGEQVKLFEQEWSEWLGVKYSVFVNSGSSANFITMEILKQFYGQQRIALSPLNWVSDVVSVVRAGHIPVFFDINLSTLGLSLKSNNQHYDAVLMTHIMGYDGWEELPRDTITVIEDCCEAHGATHDGKKCGTLGWISNFSFYFAHHMAVGEGGMICTNSDAIYQLALMMRSHGMLRECACDEIKNSYATQYSDLHPEFIFPHAGWNMRNTEVAAVVGRQQLKRLDQNIVIRNANNGFFTNLLDSNKYMQFRTKGASNYALVILPCDPGLTPRVKQMLEQQGIEFRRGASGGGNQLRQPYIEHLTPDAPKPEEFPNVEHVHFNGFYIGNYPDLEPEKIEKLAKDLNAL